MVALFNRPPYTRSPCIRRVRAWRPLGTLATGHRVVSARNGVLYLRSPRPFLENDSAELIDGPVTWRGFSTTCLFVDCTSRHRTMFVVIPTCFCREKANLGMPNACCRKYALGSEASAMAPDVTSIRATYSDTSFARSMMDGSAPLRWPQL